MKALVAIIQFDNVYTNIISKNISMFGLEGILISAESFVKFNMGPVFGSKPSVRIMSFNPYVIEIQALIPIIEVFIHRILLDGEKQEEK